MHLSVLIQYALPHRLLSRLVYWATRWTWRPWKDFLIGQIIRRYAVDLSEAECADPSQFVHFNAFFTRALKPGARPIEAPAGVVLSPADGRISQIGRITDGRIFQAKGQHFTAAELLGSDERAAAYRDGSFATVYLSPRDYHRAHMPLAGKLIETVHVPGRLFSVAPFAVQAIPRLFARNERLVCIFEGEHGPFAVVMVGAMLVSSVETVWSGLEIPPYASRIVHKDWRGRNIELPRGAEMARFNMGSTVIVLLPDELQTTVSPVPAEQPVRMGEPLGTVHSGR